MNGVRETHEESDRPHEISEYLVVGLNPRGGWDDDASALDPRRQANVKKTESARAAETKEAGPGEHAFSPACGPIETRWNERTPHRLYTRESVEDGSRSSVSSCIHELWPRSVSE